LAFFEFNFSTSRNGFVYNLLCLFPIIFWYLKNSKLSRIVPVLLFLFVLSILFSNGRAGFILIIIQSLLIGIIIYPYLRRLFNACLILLIAFFISWQFFSGSGVAQNIASKIEEINPRMAAMLEKEGNEGDLTKDKSWLLRKLMIDKTIEVFHKYPVMGIGWMHFDKYFTELGTLNKYKRLKHLDNEYLNTRSSHNSYAMYLANCGIVGISFLFIILIQALLPFPRKLLITKLESVDLPLVAMITLVIYFYAITSITGACTWFIVGASIGCIRDQQLK